MMLGAFIDQSNKAETLSSLIAAYSDAIGHFGFNRFDYSLMTTSAQLSMGKCIGLAGNYPKSWSDRYAQNDFAEDDPVYNMTVPFSGIFPWSIVETIPLDKKQSTIIRERNQSGLKNGHSMFIAGPFGEIVGMSIANEGGNIDTSGNILATLFAIMNQFNLRYVAITSSPLILPFIILSVHEREILVWASKGKSNAAIGILLGRSKKTVEFHFASIFKKLQVNDRLVAVIKAINMRLISP